MRRRWQVESHTMQSREQQVSMPSFVIQLQPWCWMNGATKWRQIVATRLEWKIWKMKSSHPVPNPSIRGLYLYTFVLFFRWTLFESYLRFEIWNKVWNLNFENFLLFLLTICETDRITSTSVIALKSFRAQMDSYEWRNSLWRQFHQLYYWPPPTLSSCTSNF